MKKLLLLFALVVLLGGASGCRGRVIECWRYAWNSRFHPERNIRYTEPQMMMADPCCDPCADPCGDPYGGQVVVGPTVTSSGGCPCSRPSATTSPVGPGPISPQ
jgi:hypothetical protein